MNEPLFPVIAKARAPGFGRKRAICRPPPSAASQGHLQFAPCLLQNLERRARIQRKTHVCYNEGSRHLRSSASVFVFECANLVFCSLSGGNRKIRGTMPRLFFCRGGGGEGSPISTWSSREARIRAPTFSFLHIFRETPLTKWVRKGAFLEDLAVLWGSLQHPTKKETGKVRTNCWTESSEFPEHESPPRRPPRPSRGASRSARWSFWPAPSTSLTPRRCCFVFSIFPKEIRLN